MKTGSPVADNWVWHSMQWRYYRKRSERLLLLYMDGTVEKMGIFCLWVGPPRSRPILPFWQSREKIYGDTLPWSLCYRLRLQEPQESVPLYLVLLTHEARLHILSNVVSHARPVVPSLLQGLVVHIDYFVPNLIANAKTSVQNVPWRVLLFQLWCNCALSVTTSYSTVGWSSLEGPSWANVQYIA